MIKTYSGGSQNASNSKVIKELSEYHCLKESANDDHWIHKLFSIINLLCYNTLEFLSYDNGAKF